MSSWSEHVGKFYNDNKGKNGINSLGDAMKSKECKALWNDMKNGKSGKSGKNKTVKKGGLAALSPDNFNNNNNVVQKNGGKSTKHKLKSVEKALQNVVRKSIKIYGGADGDLTLWTVKESNGTYTCTQIKSETELNKIKSNIIPPLTSS